MKSRRRLPRQQAQARARKLREPRAISKADPSKYRRSPRLAAKRDWTDLPRDALSLIFQMLGTMQISWPAQAVCRRWRRLATHDPLLWRHIHLPKNPLSFDRVGAMEEFARKAIDRSAGLVEEFHAGYIGSDLLTYLADRSKGLRGLILTTPSVSGKMLTKILGRCPQLEELELRQMNNTSFSGEVYGDMSRACPGLKELWVDKEWRNPRYRSSFLDSGSNYDGEAMEIAENMPGLRVLQLTGNQMTNMGLHAILDKCEHLEFLDLSGCLNLSVTGDERLKAKLAKVEFVMYPSSGMIRHARWKDWFPYACHGMQRNLVNS